MIYFFVEGTFDKLFVSKLMNCEDYKIVEYSSMKHKKLNSYIASLKQQGIDYVFLFDTDRKDTNEKLKQKLRQYNQLQKEKCYAVVLEIESWFMAGCCEDIIKKYKIKPYNDTNNYDKENMIRDFKTHKLISYYQEILESFSINDAILRNSSFRDFYKKHKSIFK